MKKIVFAALLLSSSVGAAVVMSRPTVRPITTFKSMPVKPATVQPKTSSTSNATLIAATTAMVMSTAAVANSHLESATVPVSNSQPVSATVPVADEDDDTRLANVNPTLLTLCTEAQFVKAIEWQQRCFATISGSMRDFCVTLSYQRYCTPATIDDIKGKRPARSHYINTYMR